MTKDEWYTLEPGDVVQNKLSGTSYIVVRTQGNKISLIRTLEANHPVEWELVRKGTWVEKIPIPGID